MLATTEAPKLCRLKSEYWQPAAAQLQLHSDGVVASAVTAPASAAATGAAGEYRQ